MKILSTWIQLVLFFVVFGLLCSCGAKLPSDIKKEYAALPQVVDYNFHIRPILSDRCFACHGPDEKERKADLRLDIEKEAKSQLATGVGSAIVSGNIHNSLVIQHMLSDDPDKKMPPPESNLTLTNREIALVAKWIDQGAEWKEHWSFIQPVKADISTSISTENDWVSNNEIDNFIHNKLGESNLKPSEAANQERLLRRVSMDLTGLPPTVEEIDAFMNNASEDAYEEKVDELLASTTYGERMAMEWMDLSRYADSHGMHADGWRMMWPWRDWVIDAFNANMPYDEFVTWQIAGDLFENATDEQRLATAFCRNHTMTAEGGVIDEEFRLNYVYDRTETLSTAFLGVTLGCAKCHDHKYDPFSQKEYYQMTAFFNNVRELGMTGDDGNYGPMMLVPDQETKKSIDNIRSQIYQEETALAELNVDTKAISDYINNLNQPSQVKGQIAYYPLERENKKSPKKGKPYRYFDGNHNSKCYGSSSLVKGYKGKALKFDADYSELHLIDQGLFETYDPFSVNLWANTNQYNPKKTQTLIGNSGDKNNFWRGWDLYLDEENRLSATIIHSKPHNLIHVTTIESINTDQWYNIGMSYDGSGKAEGLKLYVDGAVAPSTIGYNKLYKTILPVHPGSYKKSKTPLKVGKSGRLYTGESGILYGIIDEIRIFDRSLTTVEMSLLSGKQTLPDQIDHHTIATTIQPELRKITKKIHSLKNDLLSIMNDVPEVMVMEESTQKRKTFMYNRGEYQQPTNEVEANTPTSILPFPDNLEKNRMGLARWLFMKDNPLTARVTVNRYWQLIFGQGLVTTPRDFGLQGALPSHPALLDWLAVDFEETGWDLKQLIKKMVMSATYQQSSNIEEADLEVDPDNILLARGATYRLSAEMIRDNALAASGLISAKMGGESVKPYQPDGLWIELGNFSNKLLRYKADGGDSLYRRSLYTFIRRTSPPPMMTIFDAPNREVCVVKRESTNTPLQSLVLMNDPQFVEAARVMAVRSQQRYESPRDQIQYAFRSATGRKPMSSEVDLLNKLYNDQYEKFKESNEASEILSVGNYGKEEDALKVQLLELDPIKTAALAIVTNTILNHDDSYMKR